MASTMNTNFPEVLNVKPSLRPEAWRRASTNAVNTNTGTGNLRGVTADEQERAIDEYGIAGRVWEAAYALELYLSGPSAEWSFDPVFPLPNRSSVETPTPTTALELGSGTGLVARAMSHTIASGPDDVVIATDLPDVCAMLERNLAGLTRVELHSAGDKEHICVRPLAWADEDHLAAIASQLAHREGRVGGMVTGRRRLTHIVCSDLVYFPEILAPLLRTLLALTSPPFASSSDATATVIMSYKIRSLAIETAFWSAFGLYFSFKPVLIRRGSEQGSAGWSPSFAPDGEDQMFVFIAQRRPESLEWAVRKEDEALLAGVGARGDEGHKGDDTFESLLLSGVNC